MSRARSLLDDARTRQKAGEPEHARDLVRQSIELLLAADPDEETTAWLNLLIKSGVHAHEIAAYEASARANRKAVDALGRRFPENHPYLLGTLGNLATSLRQLGDLDTAQEILERIVAGLQASVDEDDRNLLTARMNLALMVRGRGDLHAARGLLEDVLRIRRAILPEDHPDLTAVRVNLAGTLFALGDLEAARVLEEENLSLTARSADDDDPLLQTARENLALSLEQLGDHEGARRLQEKVLEMRAATLPQDHPDLQRARVNLASTLIALERHQEARELLEAVLAAERPGIPEEDRSRLILRNNLSVVLSRLGELEAARELVESVLRIREKTLPDEHPELQRSRKNLLEILAGSGRSGERSIRFEQLSRALVRASRKSAHAALFDGSSREAEERCARLSIDVGFALSLADGLGVFTSDPEVEADAFVLGELIRGAAQVAARLASLSRDDPELAAIRERLGSCSVELARLLHGRSSGRTHAEIIEERDHLQRELVRRSPGTGLVARAVGLDLERIAGRLGPREALVTFRGYDRLARIEGSHRIGLEASLCAFVLHRIGGEVALHRVELGPIAPIQRMIESARRRVASGSGRGLRVVSAGRSNEGDGFGPALGRLLLAPVLPHLLKIERLVLIPDDVLHTVPLDALEIQAAESSSGNVLLGQRFAITNMTNVLQWMSSEAASTAPPSLVALGGAAFEAEPLEDGILPAVSSAERILADAPIALLRGSVWESGFSPLPGTDREVTGIATLHESSSLGAGPRTLLTGRYASRQAIESGAYAARFVHIATHGWFAPESCRSWGDSGPVDERSGADLRISSRTRVLGSSPMVLCGLALAGANLPPDELGRSPGLVTAEEISTWDLSNCELAVLSACDTNVGIRRAGQGVASLQKALHMAGARSVITSLWKVPDETTKELMLDFYRRMWVEKKPKRQALWEAKMRMRNARDPDGRPLHATRDWAAWVLTGDP